MTDTFRKALEETLSPEALVPEGEVASWGWDGWTPKAVVAPPSVEALADLLGRASEEGWRVLPAGLGTWLDGGGGGEAELVVSVSRLQGMEVYEPGDLTFTAGAGTPMATLEEATAANGQWLPLDPPGSRRGSLGALVAVGRAGSLSADYGTPRDHVLGVTLVSGDGRVLRWGGRVVKNVAGFDMTRLSIGSWGTLGVVASVSARLFPLPEADLTLVQPGPDAEYLLPRARAAALSSLPLAAVELVEPLPRGGGFLGEGADGSLGAALLLRIMGPESQAEALADQVVEVLGGGASASLRRLEGEESRRLHQALEGWEDGGALTLRLALLPSEMGVLLEELRRLADQAPGAPDIRASAHVGAGILRVRVNQGPEENDELQRWMGLLTGLRERLERRGGSLTVSRGPRALVAAVGAWGEPGPELRLMEGLKREMDPMGILAPGRFVV